MIRHTCDILDGIGVDVDIDNDSASRELKTYIADVALDLAPAKPIELILELKRLDVLRYVSDKQTQIHLQIYLINWRPNLCALFSSLACFVLEASQLISSCC